MKEHNIKGIEKLSDNKFLNLFNLRYEDKDYYIASRRKDVKDMAVNNVGKEIKTDAVMIVPIYNNGDLVLIKQFRPAINDYIYEFPAGLVDDNESIMEASRRELKEEVGLDIEDSILLIPPSYTSVGMSDETIAIILANVSGELSTEGNEGTEDIEPIVLKVNDIQSFINDNIVGAKTSLVLTILGLHSLRYDKEEN